MSARIGIDVGGTFTDFVLVDRKSGDLSFHKEPSTPHDPAAAIETGLGRLIALADCAPDDIELIVHGTTLSLNAILQRRGARVALVVSPGNRDLLEIARVHMSDSYGFFAQPEEPLVPRDRVIEISARISASGEVLQAPSTADIDAAAAAISAMEVDAVAVVLLNSPANPGIETGLADALAARLSVPVTASTEIWSEVREYERGMVGVMNAYIAPILRRYYDRLQVNIAGHGVTAPVSITTSNGGSVDIATAYERPIDSTLSGPASGVVAAIHTACLAGMPRIVTFDMGGTSADIAIAEGAAPEITTHSYLGEIPLILPIVNVSAIGAGGGSIIRVDEGGLLKVGPTSAGANPGPACYGLGSDAPTMTDCYLAAGYLAASGFAGGNMTVYPDRASAALEAVGGRIFDAGTDLDVRTADAALRVASSMMATEVRKTLARRGSDPRDFVLVPYGGAGPTHAALLAEEAGLDRILVAPRPGVFCALGAAMANLRRDFVESGRIDTRDQAASVLLDQVVARLRKQAAGWQDGVAGRVTGWSYELVADARYPEQAFELPVRLADLEGNLVARIEEAFHGAHQSLYGFNERHNGVGISRIVISAIGVLPTADEIAPRHVSEPKPERHRPIHVHGRWHEASVILRSDLAARSDGLAGPAIVEQDDTTTLVPPGWHASALPCGSMLVERKNGGAL